VAEAWSRTPRRSQSLPPMSLLAMLAGALGGVLLRWVTLAAPLWLAAVLLVACAAGAYRTAGSPQSEFWREPRTIRTGRATGEGVRSGSLMRGSQ
jgi:hypothetical protein